MGFFLHFQASVPPIFCLEGGCFKDFIVKLKHIGINISQPEEIAGFYTDILGMSIMRSFYLSEELSSLIFNLPAPVEVFLLQKEDVVFEIFLANVQFMAGFAHVCISVENRDKVWQKAKIKNYDLLRIEREKSDLVFLKDRTGNIFEIKESQC